MPPIPAPITIVIVAVRNPASIPSCSTAVTVAINRITTWPIRPSRDAWATSAAAAAAAEAHWLCGAALSRSNQPRLARERWQRLAAELPEEPLAWKAALEAEASRRFAWFGDKRQIRAAARSCLVATRG